VVCLTLKQLLAFYSSHVSCMRVLVSNTVRRGSDDDKFRPEIETFLSVHPYLFTATRVDEHASVRLHTIFHSTIHTTLDVP
jgi:hypothetical protein